MKKLPFYAIVLLLAGIVVGTQETTVSGYQTRPGTIRGRVFFGNQMGNQAAGPCSHIKAVATPKGGTAITAFATGPAAGAKDGQCTFVLSNVPSNVPVELKAVYSDLPSYPEKTHAPPAGQWTNPITLKPGETVMKYVEIDGKP